MLQKVLFEVDDDEALVPTFSVSKSVRNASYHNLDGQERMIQCQRVFTIILQHPEGVTDHELEDETGLPINVVTARRNDIKNFVKAVGIASYHNGSRLIVNTLWGAI